MTGALTPAAARLARAVRGDGTYREAGVAAGLTEPFCDLLARLDTGEALVAPGVGTLDARWTAYRALCAQWGHVAGFNAAMGAFEALPPDERMLAIADATTVCARALCPSASDDELARWWDSWGWAAGEFMALTSFLLARWLLLDQAPELVPLEDATIVLPDDSRWTVRHTLRAIQQAGPVARARELGQANDAQFYAHVLRALLAHHHSAQLPPGKPETAAVLAAIADHVGLRGLERLVAGPRPPKAQTQAQAGPPNE